MERDGHGEGGTWKGGEGGREGESERERNGAWFQRGAVSHDNVNIPVVPLGMVVVEAGTRVVVHFSVLPILAKGLNAKPAFPYTSHVLPHHGKRRCSSV